MGAALKAEPDDVQRNLPHGFKLDAQGLHHEVETRKGFYWEWICTSIEVLAQSRDEKHDAWAKLIRFVDYDGQTRQWVMPAELLVEGFFWLQRLVELGLRA